MSATSDAFHKIMEQQLQELKERRDLLSSAILKLEDELNNPIPDIQIDYAEIAKVVEHDRRKTK